MKEFWEVRDDISSTIALHKINNTFEAMTPPLVVPIPLTEIENVLGSMLSKT